MNASEETLLKQPAVAEDFVVAPTVVTLTANTRARLTATASSGKVGVLLTPDPANTSPVYIGDSTVTTAVGWIVVMNAYDPPVLVPMKDASKLYAYSAGTSQKYSWSVL